jgi:hypothetical protein
MMSPSPIATVPGLRLFFRGRADQRWNVRPLLAPIAIEGFDRPEQRLP